MTGDIDAENHAFFCNRLDKSLPAVMAVANYLKSIGYEKPFIAPIKKAPTYADRMKYRDGGDIFVWSGKKEGAGERWRIEAKGLGYDFTDLSDWPFTPWFAVCAKHTFDDANPKPYALFMVNPALTHAGIVFSTSSNLWTARKWKNKDYKGRPSESTSYFAPLHTVAWRKIAVA